ncbi:MAG TPA: CHAT domain-containing protein [Longimicrobium sp.]|nr:CHAT domain-containing protein [Longimicrobium sp.]
MTSQPPDPLDPAAAVALLTRGVSSDSLSRTEWEVIAGWAGRSPPALELLNELLRVGAVSPAELRAMARSALPRAVVKWVDARPHATRDDARRELLMVAREIRAGMIDAGSNLPDAADALDEEPETAPPPSKRSSPPKPAAPRRTGNARARAPDDQRSRSQNPEHDRGNQPGHKRGNSLGGKLGNEPADNRGNGPEHGRRERPNDRKSSKPPGGIGMGGDASPVSSIPPPTAAASEPPPAGAEPPTSAYALLDAPETVVAEADFAVTAGLAAVQSSGVIGDRVRLPASTAYPYVLALQLVAEGFELADGGVWRREVIATADAPYPSTVFHLRAPAQAEAVRARALRVIYSVGGQTVGFAVRPVATVRTPADQPAPPPNPPPAMDVGAPTGPVAADLTIHIMRDDEVRERLLWTVESPHAGVARMPDGGREVACDIGGQPREFARQLVQQVNEQQEKKTLKSVQALMRGIGKTIANKIPQPVWDAIHAAAVAAGGPPSILILSEEPHVPWELAAVPEPLLVPGAPPFLGAQANVGRWILGDRTPPIQPPQHLSVAKMAVVWGVYDGSRWGRLESAEAEATALRDVYGAASVDATLDPVLDCLTGTPAAEALHFAIHGIYNPGGIQDGLVLTDGETISDTHVRGGSLAARPLVFLNACQVGSGKEVLGDYAGMASAFLDARASAVIAPLWSVKDTVAKDISLAFYGEVFAGQRVADVLRRQRARYDTHGSATYLAYQFFGHPELRISHAPTRS